MRDQHYRNALALIQLAEQCHDLFAGARVEVAGGLISQQQFWLINQGTSNGHALLLAAGNLVWTRAMVFAQSHFLQHYVGLQQTLGARYATIDKRQRDVVFKIGARQQIESLKHKTDYLIAQAGQFIAALVLNIASIQKIVAAAGHIEAAKDIHKGGFAGTGRSHDRDKLAGHYRDRHISEHRYSTCIGHIFLE
jgi:hypothetical protein